MTTLLFYMTLEDITGKGTKLVDKISSNNTASQRMLVFEAFWGV